MSEASPQLLSDGLRTAAAEGGVHVITDFSPRGGMEMMLRQLIEPRGHSPDNGGLIKNAGVTFTAIDAKGPLDEPREVLAFSALSRETPPTGVVCWLYRRTA